MTTIPAPNPATDTVLAPTPAPDAPISKAATQATTVPVGALSSGARPQPPSSLSAALSFGWRALLKIKHVPEQLFDVTMFPVMMLLMFTYLFGGALAGSTGEYLQFVLPGILCMSVTMITMYTGMTLNKDIEKGVFDRFRSLPVWRPAPLVGALLGDAIRYTMAATLIIVLGMVLGFRPDAGLPGLIAAVGLVLVFSFSLSWLWTSLGLKLRTPEAVMQVSMMIMFPLTFASNVLVDPKTMPEVVQRFVDVNPVTIIATAVRGLMHGTATPGQIGVVFALCAGFIVVFGPLTMRLYAKER